MAARADPFELIAFDRFKYGLELAVDGRPLDGWRGVGTPDRSHRLDFHEVLVVEHGRGRLVIDGVGVDVRAPVVVTTAPGQVRRIEVDAAFEGRLLVFAPDAVPWAGAGLRPGAARPSRDVLRRLRRVAADMDRELHRPDPHTPVMLRALLAQWLVLSHRASESRRTDRAMPALVARFTALVDAGFRAEHRPSAYAGALGVSVDHLSDVVRAHGLGSATSVVQARIHGEACRLLLHTPLRIGEIAEALGYDDAAHFARAFRRHTGIAPSRFRARGPERSC